MKRVFAIGESLVDIIFEGWQPRHAKAGGSMLNTAVSLGRVGLNVSLITEYGNDDPGRFIDEFLKDNGVNTSHTFRFGEGKTALALAYLGQNNDARYTFYKNYPAERLKISFPAITDGDILLFGSIYSVTPEIRKPLSKLVNDATKSEAIIIYDPNFRSSHSSNLDAFLPMIKENLSMATIVRGSDEDFRNIFGTKTAEDTWEVVKMYCSCLIYTENSRGVSLFTNKLTKRFPVKKIDPVSTIGAGDNFNAGIIASLCSMGADRESPGNYSEEEWKQIISTATDFAADVCMSYDNYIGLPFASKYRSASRLQI